MSESNLGDDILVMDEPCAGADIPSSSYNASTISRQATGRYEDVSNLTIEQRIQRLEDIQAIRNLKFAYWDALDSKDWERYGSVFTEDVEYAFPSFGSYASGRQAMVDNVSGFLLDHIKSCHQGHQHFIQITGDDTAIGTASLRDNLVNTHTGAEFKGRGYYAEEYRKIDGQWYIAKQTLHYNMTDSKVLKEFGADIAPSMGVISL